MMKKLKTIITILVLSLTAFGCQTNDELIELEIGNQIEGDNLTSGDRFLSRNSVTHILVEYDKNLSISQQQIIRARFSNAGLSIIQIYECGGNSETWEVYKISYDDFIQIFSRLYPGFDPNIDTGVNGVEQDGNEPEIDGPYFKMYYSQHCE